MQFQAFNKILLEEQKIDLWKEEEVILGCQFRIRYPSYRGTFLSCIEKLEFRIDETPVPEENVIFCLNGREYLIHELKDQYKAYWFVLDYATIKILCDKVPSPGRHQITVHMVHRIPYTGYDGECLSLPSTVTKELETAWEEK